MTVETTVPDDYPQLRLGSQLCFPLYAAARRVVSSYTPYLKPLGLTYTQYIVMMALWEKEALTVGELCRLLYLDNGTVTPLLKKLEDAGYVARSRSKTDERVVTVTITNTGRSLREQAKDVPFAVGKCISMQPDEAQTLYRLLHKLMDMTN
ncbi:MAG: MarR family transcriptional regulator [Clostridia bacterium]|nr:MarR family transcriptional regulator [Clostridia bacterium]